MKRKVCYSLSALLVIISVMVFSGIPADAAVKDSDRNNAYIPVKKELKKSDVSGKKMFKSSNVDYPVAYRSDEQDWAEDIRVKDQGKSGLCWAFGITTAAEYSYAKDTYEKSGKVSEMSPGHLGYFQYNRVNDPLGNTEGDGIVLDAGEDGWPGYGGNPIYTMQHMATYSGLGLESEAPFDMVNNNISGDRWIGPSDLYDASLAYKNYATMKEAVYCPLEGVSGRDTLKSLVMEYGAATVGIEMSSTARSNFYSEPAYYDFRSSQSTDHMVTVIGWDDNYKKTNFKNRYNATPDRNGAWIVQNSWGNSWGDDGIFYVSYESADFTTDNVANAFEMQPADKYTYNFQYDGTSDCADSTDEFVEGEDNPFETEQGTKAANVFKNTTGKTISLEAVSFSTFNYGYTPCTIDIYTGLGETDDPDDGIHAGTTLASTRTAGVKTIELSEPVTIGPGERFAIMFSFPVDSAFGIEKDRDHDDKDFIVETKPGQSFFSGEKQSGWTDMNDYEACWRIKGLASIDNSNANPGQTNPDPTIPDPTEPEPSNPDPTEPEPADNDSAKTGTKKTTSSVIVPGKIAPVVPSSSNSKKAKTNTSKNDTDKTVPGKNEDSGKKDAAVKLTNTLKVKAKKGKIKIKYKKLKRKTIMIKRGKYLTVRNAKGKVRYKLLKADKKKFRKFFKVNKKTGKLTVKKHLRKGVYKLKVKVTASGNSSYNKAAKKVTINIRIR